MAILGGLLSIACGKGEKAPEPVAAVAIEVKCKDGIDDDLDGQIDCADLDCQSPGGDCRPAPAMERSVASTVADTAAFLYSGDNPLQKGCDAKVFERKRLAMLHGRVVDEKGAPLAGVRVSVSGHKEFGSTFTRADGAYDLAVNGGSRILLDFENDGYLGSQRAIQPGWQRHETLDDVGLLQAAHKTTAITANAAVGQVIIGDAVTDPLGPRQRVFSLSWLNAIRQALSSGTVLSRISLQSMPNRDSLRQRGPSLQNACRNGSDRASRNPIRPAVARRASVGQSAGAIPR